MEVIEDYDIMGINTTLYYSVKNGFPKVEKIIHSGEDITRIIEFNIKQSIRSDLYKTIKDFT
jgi:hypothetical protein